MKTESRSDILIKLPDGTLKGDLSIPGQARGIVVFAHGSGSSRMSPRNRFVARALNDRRIGTLLTDLLTEDEEPDDLIRGHLRFDIAFLSARLSRVTNWLRKETAEQYPLAYFGASTGAAAALVAAAGQDPGIDAVVSRGGRPDMAEKALENVQVPTLLIVGSLDTPVIEMNKSALERLGCREKAMSIVDGASHLFEEPGALEEVARLAGEWFEEKMMSRTL